MKHHRAKHDFDFVERIRDEREHERKTVRQIAEEYKIPYDTVRDWCYYRTRCYMEGK